MHTSVRSLLAGLGVLSLIGSVAPAWMVAHDQEPQAKPRELRIMSYNIKHGQTKSA